MCDTASKCEKCGKPTQVFGCKYCAECYVVENLREFEEFLQRKKQEQGHD